MKDNRADWGDGPWDYEEDHGVWIDPHTDLDCMINRNHFGALCGYVGVGPNHPYYGLEYDDIDVAVHGGLTYSAACQKNGEICHVPEEGREHDIWWFGFDCGHCDDLVPGLEATLRSLSAKHGNPFPESHDDLFKPVYRDWAYVTNQITRLALQLKQVDENC